MSVKLIGSITKIPKAGKAVGNWVKEKIQTYKRNKASKKLFKAASPPTGLQHPVIKSIKPKIGKN